MKSTLVIARHEEDISWCTNAEVTEVAIVQKGMDLPNVGREPSSYIWYILENWDTLEGAYYFTQGTFSDHCVGLLDEIKSCERGFKWLGEHNYICTMDGKPDHGFNMDILAFLNELGIEYTHKYRTFIAGCIFRVDSKNIKKRPREFYEKLYEILMIEDSQNPWAFERVIDLIFGEQE